MTNKMGFTFTTSLIAAAALVAACGPSVAQERLAVSTELSAQQHQDGKPAEKKAAPAQRAQQHAAPQKATPHAAAPQRAQQQRVAAPRRAVTHAATSHATATRRTSVRTVTKAKSNVARAKVNSRQVRHAKITAKTTGHAAISRKAATSRASAVHVVTPSATKNITASRLRGVPASGAGRTVIRGQNYSAWRSGYRVRHGSGWRTFVALGSLAAIAIGSSNYYPYAYISAPQPYCEGFTADGCELMWQDVQTIEGDELSQCVAYCPWHSRLGAN